MMPAARCQAAIEILDQIIAGAPAEKALTGWARRSRYAGSGDRAAVRDHVFEAVRRMRSDAALGGAMTGRGLILGALRRTGADPDAVFSGVAYAPDPLSEAEREAGGIATQLPEALDIPDWLWPAFSDSLGGAAESVATALQSRAPVHLRVNLGKSTPAEAVAALAQDGVICVPHIACETALEVTQGSRRIRQSDAFHDGLVELQDAASQAVVQALPLKDGMWVLDYCAGGGGKALAMAARAQIALYVHDIEPGRMIDLPDRAARAGVTATPLATQDVAASGPFDLVLCDAPCSGSGAWRRAPEGKWRLTSAQLQEFVRLQAEILQMASGLVAPGGTLAYATCSVLNVENSEQIAEFLRKNPGWVATKDQAWDVQGGTDGFFTAQLVRE